MRKTEKSTVAKRLSQIRLCMRKEKIDAYMIRSDDFHGSEYVSEYFKCRAFISGFTGSAGSLVIFAQEAGLWTDGRYFLQAQQELEGSGIVLHRMGEEGVLEIEEYFAHVLPEHACVGVDGRTISVSACRRLKDKLQKKHITVRLDCDFVDNIWKGRPQLPCEPIWELALCYAGKSRAEKLSRLREKMKEKKVNSTVICSLEDIAWVLNIRGNDIACTPVALGYLVIAEEYAFWFVQTKSVSRELADTLQADGVRCRDYGEIYEFLSKEPGNGVLYLDPERTNQMIYQKACMPRQGIQRKIMEGKNLTFLPKAIKNPIEIENERLAHRKDAVACTKFICWLKKNVADSSLVITERSASEKLEEFRGMQAHYLGPSFPMIIGYAQHGAIVHYSATEETDIPLKPENFVLVDSGGHYPEGTTDITRTIALGPLTWEQKHHYTLVLKGHLRLGAAEFSYGCTGIGLDCLAREALWKERLDYNHGTGHGVGYLLNVHESPNGFRSRISKSRDECMKLEEGMITSNEPGLYLEGKYGIRIENLMLCRELEKNEFGRFMGFEALTLVPYERDAIIADELTNEERGWLNAYHAKVVEAVGPYLDVQELAWLREAAAEI